MGDKRGDLLQRKAEYERQMGKNGRGRRSMGIGGNEASIGGKRRVEGG